MADLTETKKLLAEARFQLAFVKDKLEKAMELVPKDQKNLKRMLEEVIGEL